MNTNNSPASNIEIGLSATLLLIILLSFCLDTYAQDPVLPPNNFGLANIYDGVAGKPGFVYQNSTQVYETRNIYNDKGVKVPTDLKINSVLTMNQLIYLTPVKWLGGNLAFTVLIPIVKISATNESGPAPLANPGVSGDIIQGTAIQWSDRKLFGKPFFHRMELDVNIPVGSYSDKYAFNPSSHLWALSAYHAFTLIPSSKTSISMRNQFNYNFRVIGEKYRLGAYYNGNYSVEYAISPQFRIEAATFLLLQLGQDTYDGDKDYYQNNFGLSTTEQHVLGYGPGVAYLGPDGLLIEGKILWESWAQNTSAGIRPTLRVAIPLTR